MTDQNRPQERIILHSLERIRQRLWLTRLIERVALALAFAGSAAICLVLARWVHDRYWWAALTIGILPLLLTAVAFSWIARHQYRGTWLATLRRAWSDFPIEVKTLLVVCGLSSIVASIVLGLPIAEQTAMWMLPAATAAACLLAALVTLPAISHRTAAIFVDQQAGLKEKVSTALEWADVKAASPMEEGFRAPLLQSAVEACQQVHIARSGYSRLDQRVYAIAVAAGLAALTLTTLQPLQAISHGPQKSLVGNSKAADALADAIAQLEKQHKDTNPVAQKTVLEPLRQIAESLRQSDEDIDRLDKQMRIADQERQYKEMQERQDANEMAKKDVSSEEALGNLAKAAEEMRQAEAANANGAEAETNRAKSLQNIEQAAAEAGQKLGSGQMTQGQKEKLKSALTKAAGDAKKDPQLNKALAAAADAVDKNDGKSLQKNLADAGARMGQQTAQKSMTQEELATATKALDRAAQEMGSGSGSKAEQEAAQHGGGADSPQNGGGQQGSGQESAQNGGQNGGQNGEGQSGGGHQDQGQSGGGQQANQSGGGQNGEGQASQQGAGEQGASQAGAGSDSASAEDAGNGSTNMKQAGAPGSHNNGNKVGKVGTFVRIYGEKAIANSGQTNKVVGKINPGQAVGTVDVQGMADRADGTLIDYSKEMPAARQAAENAIAKDKIPPQYRDFIRDYFDQKK